MRSFVSGVIVALLVGTVLSTRAFAADDERKISLTVNEIVNETVLLGDAQNYETALNKLQGVIIRNELSSFERSTLYQMIGQYSYASDRPLEAQQAFENALDAGGLLPKDVDNIKVVIAQLMIGNGQYREGAQRLENHLNSGGKQKPQYIDLLVNAWVQAEDYRRALPWAEKCFDSANPKQRKHYDLLNFLYNVLEMPDHQADVVKQMIISWPEDRTLWEVWASMVANDGREQEAFEVMKMLYLGDALNSEKDLMKIVQYYAFYEMPYQAAEILEREMDANRIAKTPDKLKQLSGLFRQAREYERAVPILEEAIKRNGGQNFYNGLGEAFYDAGACQMSEVAFIEEIDRGYDAGKAWMLIGNCRYDQTYERKPLNCAMTGAQIAKAPISKARQSALSAFEKVPDGSREKQNARKWVQFIESEITRHDERCGFGSDPVELCYQKIKQAYDAQIFTDGFKLDDPSCAKYKADYDSNFRK